MNHPPIERQSSILRHIALALTILVLPFSTNTLAGKGGVKGKPGGSGGNSGGPVPPLLEEPPITYQTTELRWHEDEDPNFQGLWVEDVNSQGLVVGWVRRPAEPGTNGFRHAVINLGASGQATDTMIDLNDRFAESLANLNTERHAVDPEERPWRIAYARAINDAGEIACQLIPLDEPMRTSDEPVGDTAPPVTGTHIAESGTVYADSGIFSYMVTADGSQALDEIGTGLFQVSAAQTPGEEEVVLSHYHSDDWYCQIYKPNFGARFLVPLGATKQ